MRLPERFATRQVYVVAAVAAAVPLAVALAVLVSADNGVLFILTLLLGSLTIPALLAIWLWPQGRRTAGGMAWRGALIAGLSLFGGGCLAGLLLVVFDPQNATWESALSGPFVMGALGVIFGSIFTLGLPWLLGIGVSLLFRD